MKFEHAEFNRKVWFVWDWSCDEALTRRILQQGLVPLSLVLWWNPLSCKMKLSCVRMQWWVCHSARFVFCVSSWRHSCFHLFASRYRSVFGQFRRHVVEKSRCTLQTCGLRCCIRDLWAAVLHLTISAQCCRSMRETQWIFPDLWVAVLHLTVRVQSRFMSCGVASDTKAFLSEEAQNTRCGSQPTKG